MSLPCRSDEVRDTGVRNSESGSSSTERPSHMLLHFLPLLPGSPLTTRACSWERGEEKAERKNWQGRQEQSLPLSGCSHGNHQDVTGCPVGPADLPLTSSPPHAAAHPAPIIDTGVNALSLLGPGCAPSPLGFASALRRGRFLWSTTPQESGSRYCGFCLSACRPPTKELYMSHSVTSLLYVCMLTQSTSA
ncbi:unnamed protein product [Pleuronectes platessa]|uniref:Uncharacterized protein n=1 Tax=Pleuronectes platessa TaxID=8262 RepID=A0A9N7U0J0_PLEPL|nr:unnamed protein product [Pleuronectes platessa]